VNIWFVLKLARLRELRRKGQIAKGAFCASREEYMGVAHKPTMNLYEKLVIVQFMDRGIKKTVEEKCGLFIAFR
jgi:hypothetical protein